MDQETAEAWQPNQPLPGNYQWGYASRSRYRAVAGPVTEHVVVPNTSSDMGEMLCSGGWGYVGTGGGKRCPKCVALVRDQLSEG